MHLPPTGTTAVQSVNNTDWNLTTSYKGGMLEPPNNSNSSSPPGSQDLWWTERLVVEAQNEYPGELGKIFFIFIF